jgi:hypothetical protein
MLNNPVVGWAAAAFGLGASFGKVKSWIGQAWDWLNGTQGRQITKDVQAIASHLGDLMEHAGHPEPENVRKTIDGILSQLPGADPVAPGPPIGPKAAALLVGFLALASAVPAATYDLSLGSPLGSSAWEVADGGRVVSAGSTMAGVGLVFSYGASEGEKFVPFIAIEGGFGGETRNGDNFAIGYLGAGPIIPGTSVPLIVGPDWRFFTGNPYPAIMLSTSIQWGQSLWRSK